jgi:crotonobetainyl-CoA:carnitine CoA-transferase CaiB-like acyl-CoA transferase
VARGRRHQDRDARRRAGRTALSDKRGEDSWFFLLLNSNKKGVTLNLKSDRGRQMFREMAKSADVVVENLGPSALDRLGLGWDTLHALNPRLILASVKGFGNTGPYAEYKSFEWIAQVLRIHLRDTYSTGKPVPRQGNRSVNACPSNIYRCRPFGPNDYVFIHCATVEMWKTLTTTCGRPELGDDPKYADRRDRVTFIKEIDAMIEAWTEKHTKHEAMKILAGAGVPCGAVLDSNEVISDEHMRQRGMLVELEHPTRGKFPMPGNPVRLSASPTEIVRSPLLGEHNAEVYRTWLGLGADEIATLKNEGVL